MPCPVCAGLIHPIAGRCKHCKADLVAHRSGRAPSTPIVLPALGPGHHPPTNGANGVTLLTAAPALPGHAPPVLGSFLPPAAVVATLPTPRQASAWSRRWPIVVVILAAIAIVVSIVLLVMPEDDNKNKPIKRGGPAPERMDTNPTNPTMPNQGAQPPDDDPWGAAPTLPPRSPTIVPDDPIDPPDDPDPPFPPGGSPGASIPAPPARDFPKAILTTMCDRLVSCGATTQVKDMCRQIEDIFDGGGGMSSCSKYDRDDASACLTAISRFPCNTGNAGFDLDQLAQLAGGIPACTTACVP